MSLALRWALLPPSFDLVEAMKEAESEADRILASKLELERPEALWHIEEILLLERRAVSEGDVLIITKGALRGSAGGTNGMKIVRVGELAPESV